MCESLGLEDGGSNPVVCKATPVTDVSTGLTSYEMVSDDGQLQVAKLRPVGQAQGIGLVSELSHDPSDSPGDRRWAAAGQTGDLGEAMPIVQMKRHEDLVLVGQERDSKGERFGIIAALHLLIDLGACDVLGGYGHHALPSPAGASGETQSRAHVDSESNIWSFNHAPEDVSRFCCKKTKVSSVSSVGPDGRF